MKRRSIKKQGVSLQEQINNNDEVITSLLDNKQPFLLKQPAIMNVDLVEWLRGNQQDIQMKLRKAGAILFRGFNIDSKEKFKELVDVVVGTPIDYTFRTSPRNLVHQKVYQSTVYPSDRKIRLHNESSYDNVVGKKIIFGCLINAETGGETPIADTRKVVTNLSDELRDKFQNLGVMYRRRFNPGIGMDWREAFQENDIDVVKKICLNKGMEFNYDETTDVLDLKWRKKAIVTHPDTAEQTWFNHAFFFNKYAFVEEAGMGYEDPLDESLLVYSSFFGDGSEITLDEYLELKKAYDKATFEFPWKVGDVLLLDNLSTAHARNSYKGDRQIVVSIGDSLTIENL